MSRVRGPGGRAGMWRVAIVLGILAPVGLLGLPGAQASTLASPQRLPFVLQRSIVLNAKQIVLVNSHTIVRVIPFSGTRTVTLPQIAGRGRDPLRIAQPQPGTILLLAALVQARGTTLSVQSPAVSTVLLATGRDVFLGGEAATATFGGVTVSSWNQAARAPVTAATPGRPFLLYQNGSRMHLVDSTFQYLGSNVNGGSGVTWRNDGNGGDATHTTFIGNETGADVTKSTNISLTADSFAHNAQLGVSLISDLSPTVTGDTLRSNGKDGMLIGPGVTNAKISNDTFDGNGANGLNIDRVRRGCRRGQLHGRRQPGSRLSGGRIPKRGPATGCRR